MSETRLHLDNISIMNVGEFVNTLSKVYISFIKNETKFNLLPSVMLWGSPGVGKSQSIREIAAEIEHSTDKKVVVTDVRLLLFNPIDLRGIPTSNEDKTLAVWLKPKIFQMDESKDVINILFLDEISACPPTVQAAAYQITLDRTIGEHKLPDNCIVIAAGNRITDKSVVSKMPKALANRLMHIEINVDFESWLNWARQNKINSIVVRYLNDNRKNLMKYMIESDNLAFATPRTWEMVSNLLNNVKDKTVKLEPLIAGLVGKDIAMDFMQYVILNGDLPNVRDIFAGREAYRELSEEQLYVLKNNIVNYAEFVYEDIEAMKKSFLYIKNMPYEYSIFIMKAYNKISKETMSKIEEMSEYKIWFKKIKEISEGIAGR